MSLFFRTTVFAVAIVWLAGVSQADVTDFSERFDRDTSGWVGPLSDSLDLVTTGGPDGSSYVSTELSFEFFPDGSGMGGGQPAPVVFRGQDEFGFSDGAFEGNWIDDGVQQLTFDFRHNLPAPANVFARFSSPFNFPGALFVEFAPALPGQWTEVVVDINESNFISFEGATFEDVFNNVGHIQFGVSVPVGLGGSATPYRFDLDNISVNTIPEPGSAAVLFGGLLALAFRRRK